MIGFGSDEGLERGGYPKELFVYMLPVIGFGEYVLAEVIGLGEYVLAEVIGLGEYVLAEVAGEYVPTARWLVVLEHVVALLEGVVALLLLLVLLLLVVPLLLVCALRQGEHAVLLQKQAIASSVQY